MTKKHRSSEQGVALIVVLSLVAVMAMLAMVFFSSTAAESQTSQSQSSAQSAQQLAASASQMIMAQVQAASSRTQSGAANANNAVAWTSQPGLLRTFTPSGASTVYKLYSATSMVTDSFSETEDAPPENWKSSPALWCDLNAPVTRAGNTSLAYPIADPSVAAVSLTSNLTFNGTTAVPGFAMNGTAPGYSGSNPSPTNNPLPMPVRWLYVLKNGQLTTPSSVDASGNVTFSNPQPSAANPVVGRIAFWADDETCKVNINAAGYAKNDGNYWTYWDTPIVNTVDENSKLSAQQPWTNEYQRYPGHPATTGLNVVFDSLNLTDAQTLTLTPKLKAGGSSGGTDTTHLITPPTPDDIKDLKKDERLFPTVDEMFYNPARGAAAAGISSADLEARRFLLTATSRAPETTLFDTPRATIWPTWHLSPNPTTGTNARCTTLNGNIPTNPRTAVDRLIAFCSTIAPNATTSQPFYFVRNDPLSTTELSGPGSIQQNVNLWNYLQTLSGRNEPGFENSFGAKYGAQNRDQILTSIFDAIRLANLDDRTPPITTAGPGWSFTAGRLQGSASGIWTPISTTYTPGYVAPSVGPNNTRAAGRMAPLAEVAFVFARTRAILNQVPWTNNSTTMVDKDQDGVPDRQIDNVKVGVFYSFYLQSAGMIHPGQRRKMVVTGLSGFRVRQVGNPNWQQIFVNDRYERTLVDSTGNAYRRWTGGRVELSMSLISGAGYASMNGSNGQPLDARPDIYDLSPAVTPAYLLAAPNNPYLPPTGNVVLPYNTGPLEPPPPLSTPPAPYTNTTATYNTNNSTLPGTIDSPNANPFEFSGGTLRVEIYTPETATTPYQTYDITFPSATALTPMPSQAPLNGTALPQYGWWSGTNSGRFGTSFYDERNIALGDTVLAMQSRTGDYRSEVLRNGTISDFRRPARYGQTSILSFTGVTDNGNNQLSRLATMFSPGGWAISANAQLSNSVYGQLIKGVNTYNYALPLGTPCYTGMQSIQEDFPPGDFNNGPGIGGDGSQSPKTDEGYDVVGSNTNGGNATANFTPYFRNVFSDDNNLAAQGSMASPNRQMPSAVFLGSIPTGLYPDPGKADPTPWRTLLFRPDRSWVSGSTHFGASSPPDYLMLDWFHMPVVEPYAISEPFSTAGKINLNAKIMPFGDYIRRETGLHALLRSSRIVAVPESVMTGATSGSNDRNVLAGAVGNFATRYPINIDETLSLLRKRFDGSDGSGKNAYLTNAEICSVDLVPQGSTAATLSTFWADKRTTGDNSREQPYSTLFPRLTAKSNSYTVHVTAQALAPGPGVVGWQEGRGKVLSEWRGAYTIERYVDPNDARFTASGAPNFLSGTQPVGPYYRFRVLGTRRFNP